MTRGIFVTGTDTGVGKTVVSAWLVRSLDADYWKPVQTGCEDDDDTPTVAALSGLAPSRLHPPAYRLRAPLAPDQAARLEGVEIDLDRLRPPSTLAPLVVEGAGGVLVPLNARATMADLMVRLGLPVLVVARSGLGTINHTLLTLECLRRRALPVLGVVMNGPANAANRHAIEAFGNVSILAELPPLAPLNAGSLAALAPLELPR